LVTVVLSGVVAWLATHAAIRIAPKIGAVDHPGHRKIHVAPIPRIGGVAVFVGTSVGIAFAALSGGKAVGLNEDVEIWWYALALGAAAMFVMGFLDDLYRLSFRTKFAVQIAAAVLVWLGGFRIDIVGLLYGDPIVLGWASLPVTILWIVGITNAINLIDGLDGLAAGTALIQTTAVAAIALARGQEGVVAASLALWGSLFGFLLMNFNPARIFLGDSGSMFIGFMMAVISVRGSQKGATAVAALTPLLVLGLPILDTSFAILRRFARVVSESSATERRLVFILANAHRVFLPDRDHIHHKLLDVGLTHRSAVLVLYVAVLGAAGAAFSLVVARSVAVALILIGAIALGFAGLLALSELKRRRKAWGNSTVRTPADAGPVEPSARFD
jgi:UDP-GlcNAc:undecaprenyl-phosphate GlcNAc-1-phosphate transferase